MRQSERLRGRNAVQKEAKVNSYQRCEKPITDLETYGTFRESFCFTCLIDKAQDEKQSQEDIKNLADLEARLKSLERRYDDIEDEINSLQRENAGLDRQCAKIEEEIAAIKERGLVPLEKVA